MDKGVFKVTVPVGGSVYVEGEKLRKAVLRVLSVYGYLAGSSLGSRGALKMAHGKYGDVVPTSRLYLVLNEVGRANPIVEMVWETARGLWRSLGDGVKTALLLAYKLYEAALRLGEAGVHPSRVLSGYWAAYRVHRRVLEEMAGLTPRPLCREAARSLLWGSWGVEVLPPLLCRALEKHAATACTARLSEAVDVERVEGGSVSDTTLVEGVVVRKRLEPPRARGVLSGPLTTAVLDDKLYIDLRGEGVRVAPASPLEAFDLFEKARRGHAARAAERLASLGVRLLVNVKGVDPLIEEALASRGGAVLRRIPPEKARLVALLSGARLSSLSTLTPDALGEVDRVEERVYGDRYYTFIIRRRGCVSTILLRGPWYAVDTMYEEARMALRGLEAYTVDPRGLPAGGAPEVEAALRVREEARRVGGKEQLAMEAYADAIEVVPRTLARHAGLDPLEAIAELEALHAQGRWAAGIDEDRLEIAEDLVERRLLDLYTVRLAALDAGFSLAASLVKVDGGALHRRGVELRKIREPQR